MPDDERIDPIWAKAGELKIPVTIHTADPVAFFEPLDETNERWEELYEHPDWHFYGKDFPPFNDLIQRLLNVVERHLQTNFIGAHIMGYSENLGFVSNALDRYPNLYVDITERIGELGRQPYTARKFLMQYADRVCYYWPEPQISAALDQLLENLDGQPLPLPLVSQYFPVQYEKIRAGTLDSSPRALVLDHIRSILWDYQRAREGDA